MSLIAICPACHTHFSVVPDQLKISDGWVRCGKCSEVFDAIVHSTSDGDANTVRAPLDSLPAQSSFAVNAPTSAEDEGPSSITSIPPSSYFGSNNTKGVHDSIDTNIDSTSPFDGIDTDIQNELDELDSTSPYLTVGDALESVPAELGMLEGDDSEGVNFVQRWLHGRRGHERQPEEHEAPVIEAQDSQQFELAERKAQQNPKQRIHNILDTLNAIRAENPVTEEKPTYADPTLDQDYTTPSATTDSTTPEQAAQPPQSTQEERTEPTFKTSVGNYPWNSPAKDSPDTPTDGLVPFPDSEQLNSELPESAFGSRHPLSKEEITDSVYPEHAEPSDDFAASLRARAEQTPQTPFAPSTPANDLDEITSTIPSELMDDADDSALAPSANSYAMDELDAAPSRLNESVDDTYSDAESEEELEFVRTAKRKAFWTSLPMRILGYGGCTALLLALAGQYAYHERDKLAVQFPQARLALQKLCEAADCQLEAYRDIRSANVEASGFVFAQDNRYRMTIGLRNTSHLPIASPWIELTLTDSQNRPILKRAFNSYELGIKTVQLQPNELYEGDVLVDINPQVLDPRYISGYKILAFYP